MPRRMKNMTFFHILPLSMHLCWKIALLDIALLDVTSNLSLDTERVTAMVLQAVSLRVPSENNDNVIPWGFCSTMLGGNYVLPL